jgi:hypothetical protein
LEGGQPGCSFIPVYRQGNTEKKVTNLNQDLTEAVQGADALPTHPGCGWVG